MIYMETEPEVAAETASVEQPTHNRSQFERWGVTPHDLLVLTAGVLFAAATGPFMFSGWTPRMAALLAGLPLGVVMLVRLAWHRDRTAMIAVGFLAWALVGALASGSPRQAIIGQVDGNTQSVLILCGVFGFWALARTLSDRGRKLVGPVLVVALGASALIGILQIVLNIQDGLLAHVDGRANGLEGNAAFYSMTICGACAWCACAAADAASSRSRRLWLASVTFFALAIGLSGTRGSIIALGVVCIAVCWRAKTLRSALVPVAVAVGMVASIAIQHVVRVGQSSADRFSSGGTEGRVALWKAALRGFAERPVLGWGPGRARPAIQHFLTADWVRLYQPDDVSTAWNDVHNVVLQMLITTGIVGLVLVMLFVVFAVRRADFALSLAALAISINWLLQPSTLASLCIAAIFLGAAVTRAPQPGKPDPLERRWPVVVTAVAATIGLSAALALVVADVHLRAALQSGDKASIRSAASWFGEDPFVIDYFVMGSYSAAIPSDRAARMDAARREIAAEPDVPRWWNELAMTQWDDGDFAGMKISIEHALALQPNHVRSWVQMTAYAKHVGDTDLEKVARTHACDLGAPVCQPG
jgi:O-antigen ligase